jgi:DNA polymerase-3 subunit epsilon
VIDTLMIARRKHPGQQNSLDALCSRYGIDNSRRTRHGALLDAEILAEVYAELTGGKQSSLMLTGDDKAERSAQDHRTGAPSRQSEVPVISLISVEERELHRAFVAEMGEKALWNAYFASESKS